MNPTRLAPHQPSILLTGILLGVGAIGAVDEAVFHQILQWHTLYWGTDEHGRIFSDGMFHLLTASLLVWGVLRVWQAQHGSVVTPRDALLAGVLIGAGGFNLYDGLVQHLLLHLHLVNEYVCASPQADNSIANCPADLPYEIAWLLAAAVLLGVGLLWRRRVSPSG
ncbi:MAG: DUF2243 domain-containing protein [Chloroflexota bacterium]|nr:DUF2243 domain-containing protein [Chloroflexota bacterium]